MTEESSRSGTRPQGGPTPNSKDSEPPKESRIFLVDDHTMFREGLRQLIESDPEFKVCGDAADAPEAMNGIRELKPDLVIVDISLAGTSGIDLIKTIKKEYEDLPVLVVSMHDEALYAERALWAGAMGYVMKQEPSKVVKIAISVIAKFMRRTDDLPPSPLERLSDRELEVFRMLGRGKGVRQIAEEMSLSIPTINSFRNRIKEKLKLKSSNEVMLHAIHWFREEASQ